LDEEIKARGTSYALGAKPKGDFSVSAESLAELGMIST